MTMTLGAGSNYSVGMYHTSKPNLKPQEKRLLNGAKLLKNIQENQAKQPKQRLINGAKLQKNIRESQAKQPKNVGWAYLPNFIFINIKASGKRKCPHQKICLNSSC